MEHAQRPVTRMLVVDGNLRLADVLASLLADEPGFAVTGVAGTVDAALQLARRDPPDVVLSDDPLPDGSGTALAAALHREAPGASVVLWSHDLSDGVSGVDVDALVERGMTFREVVRGLRSVVRRRRERAVRTA